MEDACAQSVGAMAALIGADENTVRDIAAETDVDIANLNAPGQIVISGEEERIAMALSMAKRLGVRKAIIDSLGCTLFLELGPDDKLAGMVRRIRQGTEVLTVSDPASLAAAVERLKRA